jgi:Bacterial regulatory proteins, lacI family
MDTETRKPRRRSPTIGDVARRAGVAPTTVSFVLNDVVGSGISEGTGKRPRRGTPSTAPTSSADRSEAADELAVSER